MTTHRISLALVALTTLMLTQAHPLYASTGETVEGDGIGKIIVEQVPPDEGVFAEWTLIQPGNVRAEMTKGSHTFDNMPTGTYTLLADPPEGSSGGVELIVNGTTTQTREVPQISFTLNDVDEVRIKLTFTYTQIGIVSVNSDPKGLTFTVKGPNELIWKGTTPASYQDVPIGQYAVFMDKIEGCITPRPLSQRLRKDSRVNFNINLVCEALDERGEPVEEKQLEFVEVKIEGIDVILHDVPIERWYATYVHTAAKTGIISGYRDRQGNLTGEFGPGKNVNLAELIKIAHRLVGISDTELHGRPENIRAHGTWFEKYWSSAERKHWLVSLDRRVDPGRLATRAEVVTTLLQALDVPRKWPKGELFTDVGHATKYAASIETAAVDGLVSGHKDAQGNPTGTFGPEDPINRAEIAKIVSLAIELYIEDSPEFTGEST